MTLRSVVPTLKAFYAREAQHRRRYQDGFFIGLLLGLLWELRYLLFP